MHDLAQLDPLRLDLPQTKRGHERCVALLDNATELFLKYGYDAVSLNDIVQHAGGSKASIYKYFGNKEGLFKAICDYRRDQFFKDIHLPFKHQGNEDLQTYLVKTLLCFHQHIQIPSNAAFMRLVLEQTQRNSEIALHIHEGGPQMIQRSIAEVLKQAHEQGLLECPNPMFSAEFFFGILRNLEWRILMGVPLSKTDQEMSEYINYCVERFLDGHQKH